MNLSFNKAAQNVQQGGFLFFDRTGISGFWIKKRTARLRSLGRLFFCTTEYIMIYIYIIPRKTENVNTFLKKM